MGLIPNVYRQAKDENGNFMFDENGVPLFEGGLKWYNEIGERCDYYSSDYSDDLPETPEMKEALDWMCDTLDDILGIRKDEAYFSYNSGVTATWNGPRW